MRKQLAFDRVLARLANIAPDDWLLKGGVALEYRLDSARPTHDVDLSTRFDYDQMVAALGATGDVDLGDFFSVVVNIEPVKPVDEVETYRFNVAVRLGGRRFEELKIDIGFADPWIGEPQLLTAAPMLEFAGIPPAIVRAIPIEQHLAEKLHAYTRSYGERGSTRVKDLVDMALLVDAAPVNARTLSETFQTVFDARGTHELPTAVPAPPAEWAEKYALLAADLPIPQTAGEAHRHIAAALSPALTIAHEHRLEREEPQHDRSGDLGRS